MILFKTMCQKITFQIIFFANYFIINLIKLNKKIVKKISFKKKLNLTKLMKKILFITKKKL